MTVHNYTERIRTKEHNDCLNITETVQQAVGRAKIRQGLATACVTGSTAGDDAEADHLV